jgi:ketosteroid isomerase-like protein
MSQSDVLETIRSQEQATARGDAQGVVDHMSPSVVTFDLPPPLQSRGDFARNADALEGWFATWRDGVKTTLEDPKVLIDGDLAVVFGLSRMVGTKTDGTVVNSLNRRTVVLQREAGTWRIVHDHNSFPTAMDGSGRSLTDLQS